MRLGVMVTRELTRASTVRPSRRRRSLLEFEVVLDVRPAGG